MLGALLPLSLAQIRPQSCTSEYSKQLCISPSVPSKAGLLKWPCSWREGCVQREVPADCGLGRAGQPRRTEADVWTAFVSSPLPCGPLPACGGIFLRPPPPSPVRPTSDASRVMVPAQHESVAECCLPLSTGRTRCSHAIEGNSRHGRIIGPRSMAAIQM